MKLEQLLNTAIQSVSGFTPIDWVGFVLMSIAVLGGVWFLCRAFRNFGVGLDTEGHQNMAGFILCALVGTWVALPILIW